jgi:hypothetical protein
VGLEERLAANATPSTRRATNGLDVGGVAVRMPADEATVGELPLLSH